MVVKASDILIALSDGHGDFGVTPGKRTPVFPMTSQYAGQIMYENNFNKAVVAELNTILKAIGFKTLLVAPSDADTPLETRVATANSAKANLYVSVHANANTGAWGTWGGIETFSMPTGEGNKLAKLIHKYIMQGTKLRDRGVKDGSHLYEIRKTAMTAVLVECAFMDNLEEAELLMSQAYRAECAKEIAQGICEYYGIAFTYGAKPTETTQTAPQPVVTVSTGKDLEVQKKRFYAQSGKLVEVPLDTGKPYSVKATDIRYLNVPANRVKKVQFVYEKGKKVSEIAKAYGADMAFNFPFFYNGVILGDSEDKDIVISSAYDKMLKWKEFAFANGKFQIGDLNKADKQDFLVQGTPQLLSNEKLVYKESIVTDQTASDIATATCQRTFVGIDKDGNLTLAVTDGRTSSDKGFTVEEMALFMQHMGCTDALNGDGGGSSTLYYKGAVLNANKSNERVVNHAVLIWFNDIINEAPAPTKPIKDGDNVADTTYVTGTVDVKEGVWYTNGIKYAMENGHLSVNEKGEFKPNEPFTRAEFANWLYRNRILFDGVK